LTNGHIQQIETRRDKLACQQRNIVRLNAKAQARDDG
jgi:hypothetical protein